MSDFSAKVRDRAFSLDMAGLEEAALSFLKEALRTKDVFNIAKNQDAFLRFVESLKEKSPSSQEYNEMINSLEPVVLKEIALLEDVSILLRGDCLSMEEVDERFDNKYIGAIQNARAVLSTEKEKYAALALFMKNVLDRCFIAWNYEKKQKNRDNSRKPLLLFGIDENALSKEAGGKPFDINTYFEGQGDDIGLLWSGATALELPQQGLNDIFPGVLKQEVYSDGTVQLVKIYQESQEDIERMARITPDTEHVVIQENIFSRPESYFHLLVLCHIIMKEVAESL